MSSLYEKLAENFLRWTERGSGRPAFPKPVLPAPPFVPFPGHRLPVAPVPDDGVRHNFFSRLTQRARHGLQPPPAVKAPEPSKEPEPYWLGNEDADLVELTLLLPQDMTVDPRQMTHFLVSVSRVSHPLTLELIGTPGRIALQLCAHRNDAATVMQQVSAHFPDVICQPRRDLLQNAWGGLDDGDERMVVEFALAYPFMLPLATMGKIDPFVGVTGAMAAFEEEEAGVYQVTFAPLSDPWNGEALASVTRNDGKPFFDDGAGLVKGAMEKVSFPLYGTVVRLAARAVELERTWNIIQCMAAPLRLFSRHDGNQLTPVRNDDYNHWDHCGDLLQRRCRRTGMILNLDELTGFVRFPTAEVRTQALLRVEAGTRAAAAPKSTDGVCLGINEHAGTASEIWLSTEQRVRHLHIIGASGSGKTNLLFNLLRQDIEAGAGFALLDPHGDLVDKVLGIIPAERVEDVVLLDPSDEQFIIPFNFLSAHSDFEKTLLASDLVAVFRAHSTSWGDQMNSVFGNAIRAFLESREGGTLADLRRFLLDPVWREKFLATVTDPEIVFYWKRGFPQLGGNKSIGPILTRLETFLSPKSIRYMVSQRENRLDFAEIMDRGKIFLAKLPQGQMGKENAHLLGGLLVAKLQQMAMSRQRVEAGSRRPFFVYADEFQNFICPSMAEILSGARKYRMGFVLAHQDLRQLERDKEVGAAVLSNAFTRVVFRVGDADSRTLADGFAHFQPGHLQNLPIGKALCRIERADNDFNLVIPLLDEPNEGKAAECRREVIEVSRATYATPRSEVEAALFRALEVAETAPLPTKAPSLPVVESLPSAPKPPAAVPAPSAEPVEAEEAVEAAELKPPACLGKGGHRHRLTQERIRDVGLTKGFHPVLEREVPGGRETIDVTLERPGLRVACEISVSTTIDHEFGNVQKCLRAGYDLVAVITASEQRLKQIAAAVAGHLDRWEAAKVKYFTPAEFIAFLQELPDLPPEAPSAAAPTERLQRGRIVRRKIKPLTPEERVVQSEAAMQVLATEMRLPAAIGAELTPPASSAAL